MDSTLAFQTAPSGQSALAPSPPPPHTGRPTPTHENHEPRMSNAKTRAVEKKHRKAQARMKRKIKEQLAKKKPEKKK